MHTKWGWVAVLATVILVSVVTTGESQESEQGVILYRQYCATCHGEAGKGNGLFAAYLTVKPADLTRIAARREGEFPRGQVARIIAGEETVLGHGARTMPIWGERLQDDVIGGTSKPAVARGRIAFLVDYLAALQGTDEKEIENIVIPGSGSRPGLGPTR